MNERLFIQIAKKYPKFRQCGKDSNFINGVLQIDNKDYCYPNSLYLFDEDDESVSLVLMTIDRDDEQLVNAICENLNTLSDIEVILKHISK